MKNILSHLLIAVLTVSCTVEVSTSEPESTEFADGINVNITAPDFISADSNDTKSTISTTNGTFAWTAGDRIGIFSNKTGSATQTSSQLALTLSEGAGTSAAYSSTTGWVLVPGSTFNYFSYYPYSDSNSREQITIDYTGQTQTANNSNTNLGAYDYMYSDMAKATSSSTASFSFHHIGCLVNVNITVPEGYEGTTFKKMRLYADTAVFASSATYSVDDIVASGIPTLDTQAGKMIELSFGEEGIKPSATGVINAWLLMAPAQWKDKTITAKLYAPKYNVPTLSGTFSPIENQTAGTKYTYDVTSAAGGQYMPDKPSAGEELHILLFGHSFGIDCTEYLPEITKAAGITNVHYGRWYQANCSLQQHWEHVTANDTYLYCNGYSENGRWDGSEYKRTDEVLSNYPWDIIIFQQSVGFEGAGDYNTYQPYLNYLTHYVDSVCTKANKKTPTIGWNMFWGYNSKARKKGKLEYAKYDIDMTEMYNAIVKATQTMSDDATQLTPIPIILPPGTALQNARYSSLNDPGSQDCPSTTQLLTRDGYHASLGIGRYVAACTWFQYLIAPVYETTIIGNTFRPFPYILDDNYSFEGDQITEERASICWQCAIEAVNHPYEVTKIEE